ncbi:MAG: hypothetical protein KGL39_37465 [Patescibacteria group bacterium]|nr:hypothetical protein [Patescibacteria group bacterium]
MSGYTCEHGVEHHSSDKTERCPECAKRTRGFLSQLIAPDPNKLAEMEEGCSVTAGGMTTDEFVSLVAERRQRQAYDCWAIHRPHWTDACYEAYCSGLMDGKVGPVPKRLADNLSVYTVALLTAKGVLERNDSANVAAVLEELREVLKEIG